MELFGDLAICPDLNDRRDTLIVVNPRRIAVIVDKPPHRGSVIPIEFVGQVIKGSAKTRLQAWLAAPASRVYVLQVAESWFAGHRSMAKAAKAHVGNRVENGNRPGCFEVASHVSDPNPLVCVVARFDEQPGLAPAAPRDWLDSP
jgi:hypothetical protein